MLLTAVLTRDEIERLVASLTPVRITIDERRGRSITVGRPKVELVSGHGLRLRGEARVHWDFIALPIPVMIRAWQVLLQPRIASGESSQVLACNPVIEELDVKMVPGFVDEKVADAIRGLIEKHRDRLAWNFSRTLSRRLLLPERISPTKTFEILAVEGDVSVTEAEMRLAVRFDARFFDDARGVVADAAEASNRTSGTAHASSVH